MITLMHYRDNQLGYSMPKGQEYPDNDDGL